MMTTIDMYEQTMKEQVLFKCAEIREKTTPIDLYRHMAHITMVSMVYQPTIRKERRVLTIE